MNTILILNLYDYAFVHLSYDCQSATHLKTLYSKKYGVSHIKFAHGGNTVIHGSTKENDTIRYLSLHDNKYLRYFVGHKAKVTGLSLSPIEDKFLSSSEDKTVRLWDLRSTHCQGVLQTPLPSVVSYDPDGVIFAVGLNGTEIKMYDARMYSQGPFKTFDMAASSMLGAKKLGSMRELKFSPDGKLVAAYLADKTVALVDAYTYELKTMLGVSRYADTGNAEGEVESICFSPGGEYVYGGLTKGAISVWNAEDGREVARLLGHNEPVKAVMFNPKAMMLSSAHSDLAFWIPTVN